METYAHDNDEPTVERKTYNHAIMNVIQYTFIMSLNEKLNEFLFEMNEHF